MKLSVVIVNCNSLDYLLVCLDSVYKSLDNLQGGGEVFVVDNNSDKKPQSYLTKIFPSVKFLQNHTNRGFSQANNQAIRKANGEYVLLLNPDTVVPEDCFERICEFADSHPDAGAIGIRGISGNATIMPEHRRNTPTFKNMFYKYSLLCNAPFVKNSKRHKPFYDKSFPDSEVGQVEVTSGSFLMVNKKALKEKCFLDESYFMYFEDTDLCLQIRKSGFKVYYLPISFIHFKSGSTDRYSTVFVHNFFSTMRTYFKKHSQGKFSYAMSVAMSFLGEGLLAMWYSLPFAKMLSRYNRQQDEKRSKKEILLHSTSENSYKQIIAAVEADGGQHSNKIYNPSLGVTVGARYNF